MTIYLRVRRFLAPLLVCLFWPATLTAANVSLAWDAIPGNSAVGYGLYSGPASGLYTSFTYQGTNPTATVTGLTPGTTNYFAVTAYNSVGTPSLFSKELAYFVPFPPVSPPSITTQPHSQTVIATTPASFSASVSGPAPLSFQWYCGATAISGATNNTFTLPSAALSNAGSYSFTASNPGGVVSSSATILTVLPTNIIATVAGVYNGLFFQTNANGTPAITESTAGFLGNCVVATNGAYTAKLNIGGASYPLAGIFNISGNATATIPFGGPLLSSLAVVLQLDLFNGTRQITGAVSGTSVGGPWTAPLLGDLATNAFPQLVGANFIFPPASSGNAPVNPGGATGVVLNGILTLVGTLGDTAAIAEAVPISKDGNVPVYVNLYNNGGLLEGWLNVSGAVPTGNLTWIRPLGVLAPAGFPLGFNTVVQVTGATYNQGVGVMGANGPGNYALTGLSATSGWVVFQDANGAQYFRPATGSGTTFSATGSLTFWACAGLNNPAPSGVITGINMAVNNPSLTSLALSGLAGLQNVFCENQAALASVNASGCAALTSVSCYFVSVGNTINVSNCTSLTTLQDVSGNVTLPIQNAIIATLPSVTPGSNTLYWSRYAPANAAGDAAATAKGWTVNRAGG